MNLHVLPSLIIGRTQDDDIPLHPALIRWFVIGLFLRENTSCKRQRSCQNQLIVEIQLQLCNYCPGLWSCSSANKDTRGCLTVAGGVGWIKVNNKCLTKWCGWALATQPCCFGYISKRRSDIAMLVRGDVSCFAYVISPSPHCHSCHCRRLHRRWNAIIILADTKMHFLARGHSRCYLEFLNFRRGSWKKKRETLSLSLSHVVLLLGGEAEKGRRGSAAWGGGRARGGEDGWKRRRGMIERERGEVLGGCDNEDS